MRHLEVVVHGLVSHGRLGLAMAHQVLQVLLEALLVPQEAHGDVVVRHALVQRGQEGPAAGSHGGSYHNVMGSTGRHVAQEVERVKLVTGC